MIEISLVWRASTFRVATVCRCAHSAFPVALCDVESPQDWYGVIHCQQETPAISAAAMVFSS
ncbi:MAG: hypothetical protein ACPGT1_06860, partial [Ilumatobacteraceae bacterium]